MPFRVSIGPIASLLALSGCFGNENILGSLSGVGGENPIHLGGAINAGGAGGAASGGSGNAPGKGGPGGAGGGAETVTATCRATGAQLELDKACRTADDCALIRDSGAVTLSVGAAGPCNTLVVGINQAEEARFTAFSSRTNCPPPVGCGLGEPMLQTEDGKLSPLTAVVSADCVDGACRSHAP